MRLIALPPIGSICSMGEEWTAEFSAIVREPASQKAFAVLNYKDKKSVQSIGDWELLKGELPKYFRLCYYTKCRKVEDLVKCKRLYFINTGVSISGYVSFRVFGLDENELLMDVTGEVAGLVNRLPNKSGIHGDDFDTLHKRLKDYHIEIPTQILGRTDLYPFFYRAHPMGWSKVMFNALEEIYGGDRSGNKKCGDSIPE